MPRIVLAATGVAYNIATLCRAQVASFPVAPRQVRIQMPIAAIEAANTAASFTKIGQPNSTTSPTSVNQPGVVLTAGDAPQVWGDGGMSSVPVDDWWANASVVNAVLYVDAT